MRHLSRLLPALLLFTRHALACVACNTVAAHQLRHQLFTAHFLPDLALVVAPFPVLFAVAAVIYFRFPLPEDHGPTAALPHTAPRVAMSL